MMRSKLPRIALTVLLLIPAMGGSSLAYVCEMGGQIQRKCCCDHDAPDTSDCAKLAKRGCCDVRSTGSKSATNSTKPVASYQAHALIALASTVIDLASLAPPQSPGACAALAANGPPIFLRNCSLLH
jgi:hypothetical protein